MKRWIAGLIVASGVLLAHVSFAEASTPITDVATTEPVKTELVTTEPLIPAIALPTIPGRTFNVGDFGAVGDGKTMNTTAMQKAVAACGAAGGGRLVIPAGHFLTGPFTLVSNLELHLEKGATLVFSDKFEDYQQQDNKYQNCLFAKDCHDIAITGPGSIDGQGKAWWKVYKKTKVDDSKTKVAPDLPRRPRMVDLANCTRVLIKDVTLENSPSFHLVPEQCELVTIDSIRIKAPSESPNTDGIDPSGRNFLITNSSFDDGDDCIALKPGGEEGKDHVSCENFTIMKCAFLHGHGLSIGSQTNGGMRGLLVSDCSFIGTKAGIRMKSNREVGGAIEDCTYRNITMDNVDEAILITSYYPKMPKVPSTDPAQPVTPTTPIWRHIRIDNLAAKGIKTAGEIVGLPEMPVSDIVLSHVHIAAAKGMEIIHAKGIQFEDSTVTSEKEPAIATEDAQVVGIDIVSLKEKKIHADQ